MNNLNESLIIIAVICILYITYIKNIIEKKEKLNEEISALETVIRLKEQLVKAINESIAKKEELLKIYIKIITDKNKEINNETDNNVITELSKSVMLTNIKKFDLEQEIKKLKSETDSLNSVITENLKKKMVLTKNKGKSDNTV